MNDIERLLEIIYNGVYVSPENELKGTAQKLADYLIANGVTVLKHGRWLDGICTNCGVEALKYVDEEGDWLVYTTDYCPDCGAKMDEEVET